MKKILYLIPILVAIALEFGFATARADTDSANAMGHAGRGRHLRRDRKGSSKKGSSGIRGSCIVLQSPSNPFSGPCANLLLVLQEADGSEVERARTGTDGRFEFIAEKGKSYTLVPGSKFYELVAPVRVLKSGDRVEVRLRQK